MKDAPASPFGTALKALKRALAALDIASSQQSASNAATTTLNSGAIGANNPITIPAVADLPTAPPNFKRYKVSACGFFRAAAIDTAFVAQIIRDPAGAAVLIGPAITCDSSHVNMNGQYSIPEIIDTPPAGAVLKYAVHLSSAATNAQVLAADEASVTVTPLAA